MCARRGVDGSSQPRTKVIRSSPHTSKRCGADSACVARSRNSGSLNAPLSKMFPKQRPKNLRSASPSVALVKWPPWSRATRLRSGPSMSASEPNPITLSLVEPKNPSISSIIGRVFCRPSVSSSMARSFAEPEPKARSAAPRPAPMLVAPPAEIAPIRPVLNGGGPTSKGLAVATRPAGELMLAVELKVTNPSRSPCPSRTSCTKRAAASWASASLVRPTGGAVPPMLPDRSNTTITSIGTAGTGGLASAILMGATGAYETLQPAPLLRGPPTNRPLTSNSAEPELPPA